MRARIFGFLLICSFLLCAVAWSKCAMSRETHGFVTLCYHGVVPRVSCTSSYSISRREFAEQMEYIKTHGYNPVSVKQIIQASEGSKPLPEKAVLLTFDDAYSSYYDFVFPFLRELGFPSVLSVVGSWITNPPQGLPEPLMNWDQIREVSQSPLVEIASHTFDMHRGIQYTPQGNVGPSLAVRSYLRDKNRYETGEEYLQRLRLDFERQKKIFTRELGYMPRVLAWPYGCFNSAAMSVGDEYGFNMYLTLEDGHASLDRLRFTKRCLMKGMPIGDFKNVLKNKKGRKDLRLVQVDLDLIYDPTSPSQTDKNLGLLIDRLVAMGVNSVALQAFADPDGDGEVKSVYFPNRVLPVRADIFGWAAHQIGIRGMDVYAWMPTLALSFPDTAFNQRYMVRRQGMEGKNNSRSWYRRLTSFSPEVQKRVEMLYEDLASHCMIQGILFQDDAFLAADEDFHPLALKAFSLSLGMPVTAEKIRDNQSLFKRWTRYKTLALISFTDKLERVVKKFRPNAKFARNTYTPVVIDPAQEVNFAQNYNLFLEHYDWTVIMAYPQMEGACRRPVQWLKSLVQNARKFKGGVDKSVFKVQAYDWARKRPVSSRLLYRELRGILAAGGRHIGYYPDNCFADRPNLDVIKLEMSTRSFPFTP